MLLREDLKIAHLLRKRLEAIPVIFSSILLVNVARTKSTKRVSPPLAVPVVG